MTAAPFHASVRVEGDDAVIRIPLREVHGLRVALRPCACRNAKSAATEDIRTALERALSRLSYRVEGP